MRDLIEQETRTAYNLVKREIYQYGNKPGKHLARLLGGKKAANYIEKIQLSTGEPVYKTAEIARTFQDYYSRLYSVNKHGTKEEVDRKQEKIKAYLKDTRLKIISEDQLRQLESPYYRGGDNKDSKRIPIREKPWT